MRNEDWNEQRPDADERPGYMFGDANSSKCQKRSACTVAVALLGPSGPGSQCR